MKKLFTILTMVGCGFAAHGKAVDENTARTVGGNFLISAGVAGVKSASDIALAYTATEVVNGGVVTDYYVFNIVGGKGFVMVSGDDNVIPILAYSNKSTFTINDIAPSTKFWINGYQKQISAVIANDVAAKPSTIQRWQELENGATRTAARTTATGVSPLLDTITWNQSGYFGPATYNKFCPNTTLTAGLSITGCVATAMAQVMKFWSWPSVGAGSHTYTDPTSGATLTANYGAMAYQWSLMPGALTFISSTAQINAVATLMLHAGISVDMSYSSAESGAYVLSMETYGVNCAQYALPTYFHYKPSLKGIPRFGEKEGYGDLNIDSVTEANWIALLQTELNAGRPIIYDGEEPANAGGHCWVCDGWETSGNMFHFNWGWGGSNDAYYTVDNLAPSSLGSNLNLDQGAIIGIEPDSFPSTPGNLKLLATLNANVSSPMPYNSPFAITTKILNSGSTSYSGDFCAQVYDSSNTLVGTMATLTGETIPAGDSTAALTFNCSAGMAAMVPYIYSIKVLYRATGGSAWTPVANNGSLINYTTMGINNDTDVALYDSLHVGSHTIPSGGSLSVTTIIGDQGTTAFSGTVQAVLINIATGTKYTVQQYTSQTIDTTAIGATYTFSTSHITAPAGLYSLEIQHQYNGAGNFHTTSSDYYSNPVLINVGFPTSVATVSPSAEDVYVYPNPANDMITIAMPGINATGICIMDMQGRMLHAVDPAHQSIVTFPVNDLAAGIYLVRVQTETVAVTKKIVIAR